MLQSARRITWSDVSGEEWQDHKRISLYTKHLNITESHGHNNAEADRSYVLTTTPSDIVDPWTRPRPTCQLIVSLDTWPRSFYADLDIARCVYTRMSTMSQHNGRIKQLVSRTYFFFYYLGYFCCCFGIPIKISEYVYEVYTCVIVLLYS